MIAVKANGTILCAHCTFMAGTGKSCSHIASVLFAAEANTHVKEQHIANIMAPVSDNEECPIQWFHLLCVHMTMDDIPEGTDSVQNAAKVFNIPMLHVYIVYVLI